MNGPNKQSIFILTNKNTAIEMECNLLGNKNHVNSRCRVCLGDTEYTVSTLNMSNCKMEKISYLDILSAICKLESENAPQKICKKCAESAEISYDFKVLCEQSDKVLVKNENELHLIKDTKVFPECSNPDDINIDGDDDFIDNTDNGDIIDITDDDDGDFIDNTEIGEEDFIDNNDGSDEDDKEMIDIKEEEMFFGTEEFPTAENPGEIYSEKLIEMDSNSYKEKSSRNCCMYCDHIHKGWHDYKKHLVFVHPEKKINCNYCEYPTYTPRAHIMHMKNKHPNEKLKCHLCNVTSDVAGIVYAHYNLEHFDYFHSRQCKFCDYKTHCPAILGKHLQLVHEKEKTFQCEKCKKKFFSLHSKDIHFKTVHRRGPQRSKVCEICGKIFTGEYYLERHRSSKHKIEKIRGCSSDNRVGYSIMMKDRHRIDSSSKSEL